jgi:beta-glucosidase
MKPARRSCFLAIACAGVAAAFAAPKAMAASPPFLWGVATSSYQVEGEITNNDYDFFNRSPEIQDHVKHNSGVGGPPITLAPAGEATRSWHPAYYRRDFDNARLLGLNSFRISLEWARIEPADGSWNDVALNRYVAMVAAMRARGLRPIITLNHFTLPIWVLRPPITLEKCLFVCYPNPNDAGFQASLRGWENSQVVDEYEQFVRHVVKRLASRVDYWVTINEPVGSMIGAGYVGGAWSPGFVASGERAKLVLHNLIEAHVRAYNAIHKLDTIDADRDGVAARVGAAHAMVAVTGTHSDGADHEAALNVDYFLNDYFLNAIVNGEEDLNYLNSDPCCKRHVKSSTQFVVHPEWRNKVDFIGLQYYRRAFAFHDALLATTDAGFWGGRFDNNLFGHFEIPHGLLNDLGWEIYPQGLYEILMRIKQNWNKPVLITENGIGERADRNRAAFIVAHLKEVQRAMRDGVNIIGYLHWSLLDNWELAENYRPESRFGLFHVERDPSDPQRCLSTCHRTLTEGALAYRQIIMESRRGGALGRPTIAALASAERRFGTFTRDGKAVIPPQQTYARVWEGRTTAGSRLELLLMRTDVKPSWLALIYWRDPGIWHSATVVRVDGALTLRETWYDDAARRWQTRDHRLSGTGSVLRGTFRTGKRKTSWRATPVPAAGLWQWMSTSPWGGPANGKFFLVSNLEEAYGGKFLTYPTASHQQSWTELTHVFVTQESSGTFVELDGGHLFHLTLRSQTPDAAVTVARRSGTWTGEKVQLPVMLPLGATGEVVPPFEILWLGQRSDGGAFEFTELHPNFLSREPGLTDQHYKERDETSVLYRTFAFQPIEYSFGFVVKALISFDAGGRRYQTEATTTTCLVNNVRCTGSWQDIPGLPAIRLGDGMPAFP